MVVGRGSGSKERRLSKKGEGGQHTGFGMYFKTMRLRTKFLHFPPPPPCGIMLNTAVKVTVITKI